MTEYILPTGVVITGDKVLCFEELFEQISSMCIYNEIVQNSYEAHTLGMSLQRKIRFSDFKPEDISNQEWCGILGPDVNNLEHMKITFEIAKGFLRDSEEGHSPEEQTLILLTAITHDWAEVYVGDVSYPDKTSEHNGYEGQVLEALLVDTFGKGFQRYANFIREILAGENEKLSPVFDAIERIGYLSTALKAWHMKDNVASDVSNSLENLALEVVTIHFEKLLEYGDYSAVQKFVMKN